MTKQDFIRALLHFPVGLFVAWLISWSVAQGVMMGVAFLTYEVIEDWRIKDRSYKDVYGYALGLGVGSVAVYLWL
jgi:predicted DNA repair protein MutK